MKKTKKEVWKEKTKGYVNPGLRGFSSSAKYRGSKSWVAKITGEHKKYKFEREFLSTTNIDSTKCVAKTDLKRGDIIARESKYFTGGMNCEYEREYFEVVKVNKDVTLKELSEAEVIEKLNNDNGKTEIIDKINKKLQDKSKKELEKILEEI